MGQRFLVRRWVVALVMSLALLLLLAGTGWADKTTTKTNPDGSTTATTTDDAGNIKMTVDTSKTSSDGGQTVTTKTFSGTTQTSESKKEFKKGKLISDQGADSREKWHTKWNEQGQKTYESTEWLEKGKVVEGYRSTYVYLKPTDKEPSLTTKEYYHPDTQTWGPEPPKKAGEQPKAKETPPPEDPALEKHLKSLRGLIETPPPPAPPAPETPPGVKTQPTRFFINPWVGGGFGANQAVNLSSFDSFTRRTNTTSYLTNFDSQGSPDAAFAAGVALGTWFDYECCSHRLVFRYFGFSLNYSHYSLNYGSQGGQFSKSLLRLPQVNIENTFTGDSLFRSNGYVNSLGFQFNARYGWLPDEQISLGRLQFQVGVGPSINIVNQTPSEQFDLLRLRNRNGIDVFDIRTLSQKFNSQTVVVPGLQAEIGVKYFILPQFSVGSSMQYDYYNLKGSLTGSGDLSGSYSTPVNHFIFKMNVGYNF